MTLDEVADLVGSGRPLPPRAVVLTIDDADRSVYELAWPLLREYGVRAHVFVPTGKVGTEWSSLDVCTWDQLREMAASGTVLVGSHTRNLHHKVRTDGGWEPVFWHPGSITLATDDAQRREVAARWDDLPDDRSAGADALLAGPAGAVAADLLASRLDILDGVGTAPRWLAWPYGFANGTLDSLARAAGFRGTVSLHPRAFGDQDSTLAVGRMTLTAKTTTDQIAAILAAAAR
jgi:peptidoglycan/xylan/chitin deacetylase (PgdA/CDA1 family)